MHKILRVTLQLDYIIFYYLCGLVMRFLKNRGQLVTFEFLYGFGAGGNVLLQCALHKKAQEVSISTAALQFVFFFSS